MDRGGRPERQGPRGWVWWLGVALVQAAGLSIAAFAFFLAALLLPSTGLFSVPNSAGDRAVGVVAAAVACVAVVSGPLLVALTRGSRRLTRGLLTVAAAGWVALVILGLAS